MNVLQGIIAGVLEDQKKRELSDTQLDELIAAAVPPIPVLEMFRSKKLSVIAEVKRSSPSKGALAEIPEPEALARKYQHAGASVISVLTEERKFGGSLRDLSAVKSAVEIPVLRKEFIVNEYLVKESRAFGADLILLIAAALDNSQLKDLYHLAQELGMSVLLEVHDELELERALDIQPAIIGINSRNLKTLEIDVSNFTNLLPKVPENIIRVAESGIASTAEVELAVRSGANAILVGESLVKAEVPEQRIKDFLNVANLI